jgi:acetyl-CoA carboxylase carboxyltransferase component
MLARDRVEMLLDEDSPFLELLPLAGLGQVSFETRSSCDLPSENGSLSECDLIDRTI